MRQKKTEQMEMLLADDERSNSECYHGGKRRVLTLRLVLAIIGAVLGSFPFGYNTGSINAPESLIREFIDATQRRRHGARFSEGALTTVWALTAAIFAAGGCLGAAGAGWWATKFGRRDGSLLASSLGVLAGILMMSCRAAEAYEMIILGRFIVGIQCGLFTALTPLYLAELSPAETRGAVGVLHQLALVTGMLTAQVLGFPTLLGTERSWHVLLGLTVVPSILQVMILPFCPESPRYLLTVRQDQAGCRRALELLRGTADVKDEMSLLDQETQSEQVKPLTILEVLGDTRLRPALLLGVVLHLSQQVNGIPGVFFYSTRLFQDAGLSEHASKYTTSSLGVVMVTMGVLTVPLMDRVGRRTLQLLGVGGMAVMGALVTVTLSLRDLIYAFDIITIILILIFVVFFALGPAAVPWVVLPELFTHEARPAAVAICVFVNWTANFLVGFGFPLLMVWIKDLVFLPFVAILLLLYTFFYFKLPETKGKSFREISALVGMADSPGSESEAKPQVKDQKPELHQWSGTNAPSDSVKDHKPTHDVQSSDTVKNGGGDGHHKYGSTDHVTLFEKVS